MDTGDEGKHRKGCPEVQQPIWVAGDRVKEPEKHLSGGKVRGGFGACFCVMYSLLSHCTIDSPIISAMRSLMLRPIILAS